MAHRRWTLFFLLATLAAVHARAPVTNFNAFVTPGVHDGTVPVDDYDRHFIIVTPPDASFDDPRPVVFFFHGAGGSARQALTTYGWAELARREHFFVVFPEALGVKPDEPGAFLGNPNVWRDGRDTIAPGVKDTDFFLALLDKFAEVLPIDRQRVYVTGFSNGAGMAFALGARYSDRIAAIAPVASQSFITADTLSRPMPVYYLVGTADPLVPFHGGEATMPWGPTRSWPPVLDSAEQWARLDGCPLMPETRESHDGVRVLRYGPGRDDSEVLLTIVDGNGHHWPGTVEPLPRSISGPLRDPFSATTAIWKFFTRYRLRHEG